MYKLFAIENGTKIPFAVYRRKQDAEKAAFWQVKNNNAECVRIYYNKKKVCEYFWLEEYKTKQKLQVVNCCYGNYKSYYGY